MSNFKAALNRIEDCETKRAIPTTNREKVRHWLLRHANNLHYVISGLSSEEERQLNIDDDAIEIYDKLEEFIRCLRS